MRTCIFWRLGFRQSSFRHITRVPQRAVPDAWARPPVSWHAVVPFTFRIQVSHSTQEPPSSSSRLVGDTTGRLVAHHALVPSAFQHQVSHSTQKPPSEFLPAAPGIQQGASRRTWCARRPTGHRPPAAGLDGCGLPLRRDKGLQPRSSSRSRLAESNRCRGAGPDRDRHHDRPAAAAPGPARPRPVPAPVQRDAGPPVPDPHDRASRQQGRDRRCPGSAWPPRERVRGQAGHVDLVQRGDDEIGMRARQEILVVGPGDPQRGHPRGLGGLHPAFGVLHNEGLLGRRRAAAVRKISGSGLPCAKSRPDRSASKNSSRFPGTEESTRGPRSPRRCRAGSCSGNARRSLTTTRPPGAPRGTRAHRDALNSRRRSAGSTGPLAVGVGLHPVAVSELNEPSQGPGHPAGLPDRRW